MTMSAAFYSKGHGWCDIFLNAGEEYNFTVGSPYLTTIRVVGGQTAEAPAGMYSRWEFAAQRTISATTAQALATLASGRLPPGSADHREGIQNPDGTISQFPWIDAEGRFDASTPVDWQLLPSELANLFYGPTRQDFIHVARLMNLICWRAGMLDGHLHHVGTNTEWSLDGSRWLPWPRSIFAQMRVQSVIRLSSATRHWLQQELDAGNQLPAAHELLAEASDLLPNSPRAAVVLAATAFETAVKTTAVALQSSIAWLMQQRVTPPALQLMDQLIPRLLEQREDVRLQKLSSESHQLLQDGAKLRNDIVHQGAEVTDLEFPHSYLRAVRQVLYLLDSYRGDAWAVAHAREALRAKDIVEGNTQQ